MEQANKLSFGAIAASGLLAAILFGFARYLQLGGGATLRGVATFLTTIGWLSMIGCVILMIVWGIRSAKT